MTFKNIVTLSVFLILPVLLSSFATSMYTLTRVYVNSGTFILSILLGSFVTINFYAQNIKNKYRRYIIIFIFGIVVPILYIQSASVVYGAGWQEYDEIFSPIYFLTNLIGFVEIMLYISIFVILFVRFIKSVKKFFLKLFYKFSKDKIEKDELPIQKVKYTWIPSEIDMNMEYITLYYDDSNDDKDNETSDWLPTAHVCAPQDGVFYIKFLIDATSVQKTAALSATLRELNFYLLGFPDPWNYVKYHCGTSANLYSSIHWSQLSAQEYNIQIEESK